MLFVAIAISVLATLAGVVVVTRSALRLARRLEQTREVAATAKELVGRVEELRARAARVRADSERVRAFAELFV